MLEISENNNKSTFIFDGELLSQNDDIYLTDEIGSPLNLFGNDTTLKSTWEYDEFGASNNEFEGFGFTGYFRDDVADTYFAQAREYDAGVGRFVGRDIFKGGLISPKSLNEYHYCYANPNIYVDKNGKITITFKAGLLGELFFGVSKDKDISIDDNFNIVVQETEANTKKDKYTGVYALNAGCFISGHVQITDADTVYDLEGYSDSFGGGLGNIGFDFIEGKSKGYIVEGNPNANVTCHGIQFSYSYGLGLPLDAHDVIGKTKTIKK